MVAASPFLTRASRVLPEPAGAEARRLAAALGTTTSVADWLLRRGYGHTEETERFLEPRLAHLSAPDGMADRALAADRLARAVRSGERICVFGDYDCDGITSAAIMTEVLRALGGEVVPLLASRFDGGYGVSQAACARILATGARLLVTCDCGSSDHEALARLGKEGLDVIVIDHHLVPDEPLPAVAFLNPHRPDCAFPYKGLASCGLALSVGAALRSVLGATLDMRQWLDLVAVGTVADVAPLDGDNRALVRAGLAALRGAARPGLRALLELSRMTDPVPLTSEDVAFRIAPRLNAPGRLGPPDLALELLLARDTAPARGIAAELQRLSSARKALQETMLAEAIQEIEREGWAERPAIVVGREGWNHGIVGIVAGRLAGRYVRPVIVVGFDGEGTGRGSVRGPPGSRLHDALSGIASSLERFGGHQAAAGVEVKLSRLGELRAAFETACDGASAEPSPGDGDQLVRLAADDDPGRVVADLDRLEPCGPGNPAPLFVLEARIGGARQVRGGHLQVDLRLEGGRRLRGFGAEMGGRAERLGGAVTVIGKLRRDTWTGGGAEVLLSEILG